MKRTVSYVKVERDQQAPLRSRDGKWPFMSQNEMLEELERLVCPLTSQTLRRWQKDSVISTPTHYSLGLRKNIASYSLFLCAECYAAAILSLGKSPIGDIKIESALMPKITLATLAYVRDSAYGHGARPILPHRAKIERALGYELPELPDYSELNLDYYHGMDDLAKGQYAEYFDGCQILWKLIFMDGMIKFGNAMKLRKADPLHNLQKHEN